MTSPQSPPAKPSWRQKLAEADLSFFIYFGARMLSGIAGVVMLRFLVTLLSKGEYADWGYYRTIGAMLVPVMTLSLPAAMMRMYFDRAEDDKLGQSALITTVMWLCAGSAATLSLGGIAVYLIGEQSGAFVAYFGIVAPAVILISFFDYLSRTRDNPGLYTLNRFVESAGFALLLWLSIGFSEQREQFTGPGVSPLMWTIILYGACVWSTLVFNTFFYIRQGYIRPFSGVLDREQTRELVAFSAPLTGTYFIGWALNSSDVYLLDKLSTSTQLADYIFSVGVAMFVGMVTKAALNDWPRFFYAAMRDDKPERDALISRRITMYLAIHVAAIVAIRLIAGFAYELLNAADYREGLAYIGYIALGNFFFLSGNIAAAGIGYVKKTRLTLVTFIVPGLLNVGLNIWLIPDYGALAAAATTLAAFVVFALTSFAIGRKFYRIQGMGWICALIALAVFVALVPLPF